MAYVEKKKEEVGVGSNGDNPNSRMLNLLNSGLDSDVKLIVGTEKKHINAHKIILKSGSPVFRDMFTAGQEEIDIPDVEPKNFELLLKYIYTGAFSVEIEDAIPVLNLANIYKVPDLAVGCGKLLATTLNEKTVFTIFRQAVEFKEKTLEESSLQLICKHAYKYLEAPQFLELSSEHLCKILSLDDLGASSENQIFEAVIRWAEEECKRHQTLVTEKYLRSYLDKIIPLIRFPQMTLYEFSSAVLKYNILTTEEIQLVGLYQNVPKTQWSSFPKRLFNPNPRNYKVPNFPCILKRLTTKIEHSYLEFSNKWHRISFQAEEDAALVSIGLNQTDKQYAEPKKTFNTPRQGNRAIHEIFPGHEYYTQTQVPFYVTVKLEREEDGAETLLDTKTDTVSVLAYTNHHVKFNKPIQIMRNIWYTASLKVEGDYYGTNFNTQLDHAYGIKSDGTKVKFAFRNSTGVKDDSRITNVNGGQMAEFGFLLH